MAFDFTEWAKSLPSEARGKLVDEGYDELSTLLVCTEKTIDTIIPKHGHKAAVWEHIQRLQKASCEPGAPVSSKLLTRTKTEIRSDDPSEIRIVLFGKTGAGKSTTGNAILGVPPPDEDEQQGFHEFFGQGSGTVDCRIQAVRINGRTVRVIDTPGVCDTHRDPKEVLFEIAKCLLFTAPGPHILLFVINGRNRFTEEEYGAYKQLREMFNPSLTRYVCIAFTNCEGLKDGKKSLEELFATSKQKYEQAKLEGRDPADINKVLDDVDRRYLIMYPKGDEETRDRQVLELLKMVDHLQSVNPSPYFQDEKTKAITIERDLRIQEIMREQGIRDKSEAFKKLLEELQQNEKLKEEMEEELQRKKREEEDHDDRDKKLKIVAGAGIGLTTGALVASVALTLVTGGLAAPLAAAAVGGAVAAGGAVGATAEKGRCSVM